MAEVVEGGKSRGDANGRLGAVDMSIVRHVYYRELDRPASIPSNINLKLSRSGWRAGRGGDLHPPVSTVGVLLRRDSGHPSRNPKERPMLSPQSG